jgi:hypothetical protein
MECTGAVVRLEEHKSQPNASEELVTGGPISVSSRVTKPVIVVVAAVAVMLGAGGPDPVSA